VAPSALMSQAKPKGDLMFFSITLGPDEEIRFSDSHRHKYGSAMAELLDALMGLSGYDEMAASSVNSEGMALFGRRVLWWDSNGFVDVTTHESADSARRHFDATSHLYDDDEPGMDDLDDIDAEDEMEPHCSVHDAAHELGGFACELASQESIYSDPELFGNDGTCEVSDDDAPAAVLAMRYGPAPADLCDVCTKRPASGWLGPDVHACDACRGVDRWRCDR
jgi:hypothetical protein